MNAGGWWDDCLFAIAIVAVLAFGAALLALALRGD